AGGTTIFSPQLVLSAFNNIGTPATQTTPVIPLGTANIGFSSQPTVLTAGAASNILVSQTGTLALGGISGGLQTAASFISLSATSGINGGASPMFGQTISLISVGGGVGGAGSPVLIGVPTSGFTAPVVLTLNAQGSSNISSVPAVQLTTSPTAPFNAIQGL